MSFKRKLPWTRQPQYPVRVDRSNPLGRTVTHCLPLNGDNREIVTGTKLDASGTAASIAVDIRGKSLKSAGGAACASVPIDLSPYTKASVSFWMYWDAYADDDALALEYGSNFTNNSGFLIDPNSGAPAAGFFQAGTGSSGAANAHYFSRPTAAAWHHYVFNFDRTTGAARSTAVWVDGASQAMSDAGAQSDVVDNFANNSLYLFSRNNASLFGAGRMQNLVIRGGYLMSAAEAKAEYDNPWQIFEPLKRNIYVAAVGGAIVEADANSSGIATATGVSGAIAGSDGASAGVATATGVSGADAGAVAASAGVATTSGVSGEIVAAVASSAGTSTAQADTSGTIVDAVASSSGTSTASGISGAIQGSVGASSGSSTAEGAGADGAAVVVVESNSGGYYIRLPDYRRKKRQQEESEPVQTKRQTKQVIKPLFYADDTNQLSPYVPALFDVFAQRQAAQMEYRRMYNIRARAALLAA